MSRAKGTSSRLPTDYYSGDSEGDFSDVEVVAQSSRVPSPDIFGEAFMVTDERNAAKTARKGKKKAEQESKQVEKQKQAERVVAAAAAAREREASAKIYAKQLLDLKMGRPVPEDVRRMNTCHICGKLDLPPHSMKQCSQKYEEEREARLTALIKHLDDKEADRQSKSQSEKGEKGGYRNKSHKKRRSHKKHKSYKKRR